MKKKYEQPFLDPLGQIYIGIPRERVYIPKFVDNRDLILAEMARQKRGSGYYQAEGHRVDRNRDAIALHFMNLAEKPPWLLMLDSDMEHPVDVGIRLAAWGLPIIGGLYFHRGATHDPFAFKKSIIGLGSDIFKRKRQQWMPMRDEVYDFLQNNNVPRHDGSVVIGPQATNGLLECDAVATGAIMIHRSVLEQMERPWFEYRAGGHSEDLIFCDEAKFDYGIPIHCDMSTMSGHFKWQPMGQSQFRQMYEGRGVNLSMYDMPGIAQIFAEYREIEPEAALEELQEGNAHMVGNYWRSKTPKTPEEVRKFYADPHTGYLYLIELIHWNASGTFDYFKKELLFARNMNVLELGSGIGSMAIQLAVQSCNVVASEVNTTLREFAKLRWKKLTKLMDSRHGTIKFVKDTWKKLEDESQDMVVAFDVIEHLPEEDVAEFVQHVGRILRPGGIFSYHNNWGQQDLYPMHFSHEKLWSKWLSDNNLNEVSQIRAVKMGSGPLVKSEVSKDG